MGSKNNIAGVELDLASLQSVLDASPVAFLLINEKTEVIRVNRAAAQMVRKNQEELLNRQPGDGSVELLSTAETAPEISAPYSRSQISQHSSTSSTPDVRLLFSVRDTGPGIPKDKHGLLFQ